jgi:DNA recombination protein RmuC
LRAVEHGWREERIAKNAAEISALGAELYNRVARMTSYLEELRGKLDGAVRTYNDLIGSYEGRVLVQARKFKDLGATAGDEIPVQERIKTTPRLVQSATLLDVPEENGHRSTHNGDRS